MRIRFSLRVLLLLPLLPAALWGWLNWPDYTLHRFAVAVASRDASAWDYRVRSDRCWVGLSSDDILCGYSDVEHRRDFTVYLPREHLITDLVPLDRSMWDLIQARACYVLATENPPSRRQRFVFVVQRGRVMLECRQLGRASLPTPVRQAKRL